MASSSSDWPVHQLWPPPDGSQRTELDLVFFHGLQLTANYAGDSWSTTWTQRWNNDVCWPEKWLPFDLGEAVRIFSVSYNAHVVTSPHRHVSEIAHNLVENLMDRREFWWTTSAQRLARDNHYMVEDANHMEVCRPPSKEHPSYWLLLQLIKTCHEVGAGCDQTLQEVYTLPQSTFGLESYVETVETLVTSEGRHAASQYVGVFGMGGVGKTLLLHTVNGSAKVLGHFQGAEFIWLTVGQTPDIMALYRTLSEKLHLDPDLHANPEDCKRYLHTGFMHKRVFLVLDDVWSGEAFDSLDFAKGNGSVTLLSTRIQSVLERASPDICLVHMTPLSPEDSWSLFCAHAFKPPSNVPCELKALAQSMSKECQGLPLALKIIGRAMFGKTSPELQWEPLLKNLRESRMQEKPVQELYERLKLGYDLLSEDDGHLKDSFLYFAAFPEDSMIYFKDILWHWIGMGFVPGNVGDDPRADAFSLLDKLRKRCFIESHGSICSEERDVLYFTVHDVMRDLAFYILVKDKGIPPAKELYLCRAGQNLEEFPQEWKVNPEAWILSLEKNKLEKLPSEIYAPKLVSLLLGYNPMNQLPRNFLSSFPKLRVLNLSGGHFIELPEAIGDLINLVWLDVQHCYLRTLPDSVRKLQMLKHLDVGGCQALMKLPSGIVELTSLQILNTFNCEELRWAEHTQSGRVDEFLNPTNAASLDDICSLVSLTELRMADSIYPGRRFPNNISALSKLKVLHLELRHIETLPADMAYWFMQLEVLQLWGSDCMQRLPRSFTSTNAFPALINFELIVCFTLLEFPEVEQGALPKLQTLKFFGCASLQSLPLSLELLINLRKLTLIYLIYTPNISSLIHSCRINCEKSWIWKKFVIEVYNWMDSERLRLGGLHLD